MALNTFISLLIFISSSYIAVGLKLPNPAGGYHVFLNTTKVLHTPPAPLCTFNSTNHTSLVIKVGRYNLKDHVPTVRLLEVVNFVKKTSCTTWFFGSQTKEDQLFQTSPSDSGLVGFTPSQLEKWVTLGNKGDVQFTNRDWYKCKWTGTEEKETRGQRVQWIEVSYNFDGEIMTPGFYRGVSLLHPVPEDNRVVLTTHGLLINVLKKEVIQCPVTFSEMARGIITKLNDESVMVTLPDHRETYWISDGVKKLKCGFSPPAYITNGGYAISFTTASNVALEVEDLLHLQMGKLEDSSRQIETFPTREEIYWKSEPLIATEARREYQFGLTELLNFTQHQLTELAKDVCHDRRRTYHIARSLKFFDPSMMASWVTGSEERAFLQGNQIRISDRKKVDDLHLVEPFACCLDYCLVNFTTEPYEGWLKSASQSVYQTLPYEECYQGTNEFLIPHERDAYIDIFSGDIVKQVVYSSNDVGPKPFLLFNSTPMLSQEGMISYVSSMDVTRFQSSMVASGETTLIRGAMVDGVISSVTSTIGGVVSKVISVGVSLLLIGLGIYLLWKTCGKVVGCVISQKSSPDTRREGRRRGHLREMEEWP